MATQKSYSADEASSRLKSLPPEIRDFIYGPEMTSALTDIGAKYALHVDQVGSLEAETGGVLLGFTEPQDFASMISERVGVDEAVGKEIAADIDAKLLEKVRGALKKMTTGAVKEAPTSPSAPPAVRIEPAIASPSVPTPKVVPPPPPNLPVMQGSDMHPAELSLSHPTNGISKTVNVGLPPVANGAPAKPVAPEPKKYTSDPYREPVE